MQVIFNHASKSAIDQIKLGKGIYTGKTVDELQALYPESELMDEAQAVRLREASYIEAPKEVDSERFLSMLEILPPMAHVCSGNAETFKLCEFITGNVTRIFARVGKRHFEMADRADLSHSKILDAVYSAFPDVFSVKG